MTAPVHEDAVSACLLCLVQTSSSMRAKFVHKKRLQQKGRIARDLINAILDQLLIRFVTGDKRVRGLDIGVIGYSVSDGRFVATPLLPGADQEPFLVSLAELSGSVAKGSRKEGSVWIDRDLFTRQVEIPETVGAVADAMAFAMHLVHRWLTQHRNAWPPIVLHVTDGDPCGGLFSLASRSLELLAVPRGCISVAQVVLSERTREAVTFNAPADPTGPWRRLWESSSPVPRKPGEKKHVRAFCLNIPTKSWTVLERLLGRRAVPAPVGETLEAAPCEARAFWHVKQGNAADECEDVYALGPSGAVAAVSDGASESIYARQWSRLLVDSFVREQPDLNDHEAYSRWLHQSSSSWMQQIDYPSLRWSQQKKVDRTGAAATLLTLQVQRSSRHRAGEFSWKAWAVGDTCLFWVRGDQLRAAFPIVSARHFVLGPSLLRTKQGLPLPVPIFATGICRSGDLFLLATDAVAQNLLQSVEEEKQLNWNALATAEETAWRHQIDALRKSRRMVNDDCTLVALRINGDSVLRHQGR